jgi:hypothetical protein
VKLKAKVHESNAAAAPKQSSPRRRVSAQQARTDLIVSLGQSLNGKQTVALFRLRMAFSVPREDLSLSSSRL